LDRQLAVNRFEGLHELQSNIIIKYSVNARVFQATCMRLIYAHFDITGKVLWDGAWGDTLIHGIYRGYRVRARQNENVQFVCLALNSLCLVLPQNTENICASQIGTKYSIIFCIGCSYLFQLLDQYKRERCLGKP
jgi:hypothetical protein